MAYFFSGQSHTFNEYLLVPGYSSSECIPDNVSLRTPLTRFRAGEEPALSLNVPMVSAVMQSVSGDRLAVALAQEGGVSFLYGSQSIEDEAAMVARVKSYKAGFVRSDSNISPDATLSDILALREQTGHSTVAVTEDGTADGRLVGIVTSRDYRVSRMAPETPVREFMTPREKMITAPDGTSLKEANNIIWEHKLNSLPIVNDEGRLCAFVFRKDYDLHKQKPNELLDSQKRYLVGAGINTRDYAERVPALVDAGVDVLVIDSSEGYSEWQKRTLEWIRERYGDSVKVGAGNVVDADGFRFLADCGADFVKVGIGGGSMHHARDQGHRPRPGDRRHRGLPRTRRVLPRDRHLRARLLRRRHRARSPHHARAGHGRGLRDARPLLRPLRREPVGQGQRQRHAHEGVLGRGLQPRAQLAALRPRRQQEAVLRGGRGLLRALRRQALR